jgi:hypothetical protein
MTLTNKTIPNCRGQVVFPELGKDLVNVNFSTSVGILQGVEAYERYPAGGELRSVILGEENVVLTPCGPYIPNYHFGDVRKKYAPCLTFYPGGALRSIRFETQMKVPVPPGTVFGDFLWAEHLTFYQNGAIKRVFPLDGKLSGFWGELDEVKLAQKLKINFLFGERELLVSSLYFYPFGKLKSVTLWPGVRVKLPRKDGVIQARIGFSLDPEGRILTLEPDLGQELMTPIGKIIPYDPFANGINADHNSLELDPLGRIVSLKSLVVISGTREDGSLVTISPQVIPHPLDLSRKLHLPLTLRFLGDKLQVDSTTLLAAKPITVKPYFPAQNIPPSAPDSLAPGLSH